MRRTCSDLVGIACLSLSNLLGRVAFAQPAAPTLAPATPALQGFLDFNGYYDTREATVLTINTRAQLNTSFEYVSFVNFNNSVGAARLQDFDSYLTEQNLRFAPHASVPLDLTVQWSHRSGPRNDVLRAGVRFRLSSLAGLGDWLRTQGVTYAVTLFPWEADFLGTGYRVQVEHGYRWQVFGAALDRRVYVSGFLDHNLMFGGREGSAKSVVVTEHQLGLRVVDELHVVAEWRLNQYAPTRQAGVGIGLQYVVNFRTGVGQ